MTTANNLLVEKAYLLTLLEKEEELHANRGDPASLGSMKAAVGQEDPKQCLVLP